jgi:hypothetical protein
MKKLDNKIEKIIFTQSEEEKIESEGIEVVKNKDGLFESNEVVNKKFVTKDGRQLLKEVKFES